MVIASGQDIFDDALNLAACALICLEDDTDTSTWNDLSYIGNGHGLCSSRVISRPLVNSKCVYLMCVTKP